MDKRETSYRWNMDRVGIVVDGWKKGTPISDMTKILGASRSAIVSKAESLKLGPHPLSSKATRDGAPPELERQPLTKMEPEERAKYIRLPQLEFLEHRFPWEREMERQR